MRRVLASVDVCIGLFKRDYQPESIEPKVTLGRNPAGPPKGTGSRRALEILPAMAVLAADRHRIASAFCRFGETAT